MYLQFQGFQGNCGGFFGYFYPIFHPEDPNCMYMPISVKYIVIWDINHNNTRKRPSRRSYWCIISSHSFLAKQICPVLVLLMSQKINVIYMISYKTLCQRYILSLPSQTGKSEKIKEIYFFTLFSDHITIFLGMPNENNFYYFSI